MKNAAVIQSLGYLGLLPFLAALLTLLLEWEIPLISSATVFLTYSAIILSFLSGSLWGKARELPESTLSSVLLITSNALALSAWLMLLLGEDFLYLGLSIALVGYIFLYWFEWYSSDQLFSSTGDGYLNFRLILTSIVGLAHLIVMILI